MKSSYLFLVAVLALACSKPNMDEHSPETSLADLKVHEGLEAGLFASEPMFTNPTNMDIDSRGRVWICEAYNYRNQNNPKNPVKKEGDRIVILEDTDGDGDADESKVFYQGTDVNAALGICVLGKRVIVSCAPNVFVFTDEDGDDVPEKKEILFQGIEGEQHDHAIHSFNFGYDGRLYFNMGNAGGQLLDAKGDTVVDIHGKKVVADGKPFREGLALRCDLDGSNVEVLGHNFRNNYELTIDPFGNIWQSDNDDDGNRGVRINFVMEFGNFGFKDEMTGAAWTQRRTNLERDLPARHWHINDPGVVPNLLQTGSGSPTGITMYEGTMLPEAFHGQMIHAEPGHNVVRAYPLTEDGAGFRASTVNILEGQKDQWFRPADITVAPDGSLFVADWYDPGVGGHQVGDLDRGRVYRVAKPGTPYKVEPIEFTLAEGVMRAFLSPNPATRYLGWTKLRELGDAAEVNLKQLWKSDYQRLRAQAFWLLIRLTNGDQYLQEALTDKNPAMRILGVRGARMLKKDLLPIASKLVADSSFQVLREVAISLRGYNTQEAADLWTSLAVRHNRDRWFLEALGIGAEGNWDLYFNTWKKRVGKEWNTPGGRDLIWRSRSKDAMPMLASLIKDPGNVQGNAGGPIDVRRYFRAFDFHNDASKQMVLAKLVTEVDSPKTFYALKHMSRSQLKMTPSIKKAIDKTLDKYKNRVEFVDLASTFKLEDRAADLLQIATNYPDSIMGKEAARVLLGWDRTDLLSEVLRGKDINQAIGLAKSINPHMYDEKAIAVMEGVMQDTSAADELRKLAVRSFGSTWRAENHLLDMARESKIPPDLQTTAAGVFQTVYRSSLREEAAKYLTLPGNKEGASLPPVSVLVEKKGNASNGKVVYGAICANCHVVDGEGVNFGPELSEIGSKLSREAMYTAILYPDQGVSFGYEGYTVTLNDGGTAFGRIVSETSDEVVMQYMSNSQTLDKTKVVGRVKLESSMMPTDLQSTISEKDLVDLVEYLMGLKRREVAYSK